MMSKRSVAIAAMCGAAMAVGANGQVLETAPPNNGSGGVWFDLTDLTPSGNSIEVNRIDVGGFTGTVGSQVPVEIWTKRGSHVGFIEQPAEWELLETITVTRQGSTTPVPLELSREIEVPDGETVGVYLQALESGGVRYTGTGANPPQEIWENDDLRLFGDHAIVATSAFSGSLFSPRTFSGSIHYRVVEGTCIADWNGDGEVDINDFFAYLSDFEAGDPRADLNNDGEIDINDFFIFLTEFEQGC